MSNLAGIRSRFLSFLNKKGTDTSPGPFLAVEPRSDSEPVPFLSGIPACLAPRISRNGGADIPVCQRNLEHNGRQECLPHRTRCLPMATVLLAGLCITVGLFCFMRYWEQREWQSEFNYASTHPVEAIRRATIEVELVQEALREYFYGDPSVTRREFAAEAQSFLPHLPATTQLQWVPRVTREQRIQFERDAHRAGAGELAITERAVDGRIVPAGNRKEYYPVWYSAAMPGIGADCGYDLASNPALRLALERSRDGDKLIVSGLLTTGPEVSDKPVVLTILPVYEHPNLVFTQEDRKTSLRGFLVGVCRPDELIENALSYDDGPQGVDIRVIDRAGIGDKRVVYFHASRTRNFPDLPRTDTRESAAGISRVAALEFGGRPWSLACTAAPSFFAAHTRWRSWAILGGGLLISAIAAAYALAAATRRQRIERIVDVRTRELRQRDFQLREAHEETIQRLVTASLCRDEETGMHIRRTGLFSEMLARAAGWSDADAETIRLAAPMHDVGKIGIPDAILRKPGKLTAEEFEVMKTHTTIGGKMLSGSKSPILRWRETLR